MNLISSAPQSCNVISSPKLRSKSCLPHPVVKYLFVLAVLPVMLFSAGKVMGQTYYVFKYGNYYLYNNNGNPAAHTDFTKSNIWIANNTLDNSNNRTLQSYTQQTNNGYLRGAYDVDFEIGASHSIWRQNNSGALYAYNNRNNRLRYVRYNNGVVFDNTNTNNFITTRIYIGTKNASNPSVNIDVAAGITSGGIKLMPRVDGQYNLAYDSTNYNETTYYWTSSTEATETHPELITDWSDATLTWTVTTGATYASVSNEGLVTITGNPTGNIVVRLGVSKGGYSNANAATITLTRAAIAQDIVSSTVITGPTISPSSAALYYNEGSQAFTSTAEANNTTTTIPTHTTLTGGGNTYYYYNGNLYTSTEGFSTTTATPTAVTLTWSLSGDAASYLTRTPATGTGTTVTHSSQSPSDLTATLTVTASATGASNKTATATITAYGPMVQPTITRTGNTISLATTSTGATIYYTTDNSTPTAESTPYTVPFDLTTSPTTVKAIAIRDGHNSTVASETFYIQLATPVITVSKTGLATIAADEFGATIYYTTDGSTPTSSSTPYSTGVQLANMQVIKAIAIKSGFTNSEVATADYVTTGISGTKLIIDDREDHTWTYYSAKPDNDYPDALHSPDPRNVKITYKGGSVANASAVAVSTTESVNEFVYYKTIERHAWGLDQNGNASEGRWLTGDYAYRTIPNPFQKRPRLTSHSGTTDGFYGFNGWKIISGGEYISGYSDNGIIPADELINFVDLPAGNDGNGAIVLEAQWTAATITEVNGNVSGNPNTAFTGGTYETNFIVVTGDSRTISGMTRNATVMGCYPDGTGPTGASLSTVTGSTNDLKIENINLGNGSNDFTIRAGWLIVGRGCTGNVRRVIGDGSTGATRKIRFESGLFNFVNPMSGGNASDDNWGRIILGCDYDRATNDGLTSNDQYEDNSSHRKLRVINYVSFNGSGAAKGSNNSTSEWIDINIKSGYYGFSADRSKYESSALNANNQDGMGLGIGGNTDAFKEYYNTFDIDNNPITYEYTDWSVVNNTDYRWQKIFSFYCGRTRGGNSGGVNRVLVEGGELCSINGGGYKNGGGVNGTIGYHLRVKGGWIKGAVYGTASASQTTANTRQVITGGEINGWIAGGCNGTDVRIENGTNYTGDNTGKTYIYVGGDAEVRSHKKDGKYNNAWGLVGNVEGGNIFASGRGNYVGDGNANLTYSGSTDETCLVVADKSQIEQNIAGGGYIGIAKNSLIYILDNATIGKNVYGGTMTPRSLSSSWYAQTTDIRMYGGTVEGSIYGGHYQGTGNAGKIQQTTTLHIDGGTVGSGNEGDGVFGGGYGSGTGVGGDVNVFIGKDCNALTGATINGNVYGGSAMGTVNDATSDETNVTLYKGTIYGGLYGGGYGPGGVAANVNGAVQVTVLGGSVLCSAGDLTGEAGTGSVFGCNNAGGAPQSTVRIDIYKTDQPLSGYALHAVYGGGNKAAYNGTPVVNIHGCSNSIEYVYGGGNAADVAGTNVTIWGGKIGNAFGGGNGFSAANPPNHNNPSAAHYNPGADITSSGTHLTIHGGTIGAAFGGSNQYGTITGGVNVNVRDSYETGDDPCGNPLTSCPMDIDELYSGGNEAPLISSRTPSILYIEQSDIHVTLDCSAKVGMLFGGAKKADYVGNINLVVNGGTFNKVFGGNNQGGTITGNVTVTFNGGSANEVYGGCNEDGDITGTIIVNIDSTNSTCTPPFWVGNVYGGGNEAAYSHAAGYPEVNIINGTVRQNVYGGGFGSTAVVTGTPKVTIGVSDANKKASVLGNVFGGGNAAGITGSTDVNVISNSTVKGNVFGGGNEAPVSANTHVWIRDRVRVYGNIYGGGNRGEIGGDTKVIVNSL